MGKHFQKTEQEQADAANKLYADSLAGKTPENSKDEPNESEKVEISNEEAEHVAKSNEQVAAEFAARVPENKRTTVNVSLVNSAEPWDFKEVPEFFGTFTGETVKFPEGFVKDGIDVGGQEFAYIFTDDQDGKYSVPMSHLINKAMDFVYNGVKVRDLKKPYMKIHWMGLKKKGNGQSFNDYDVQLISFEE